MDLTSIIDWAKLSLEMFISKIFTYTGGMFFSSIISSDRIIFFMVVVLVGAWIFSFYYFLLPILYESLLKNLKTVDRAQIISLIPKRSKIIFSFIILSVIYFTFFIGLINLLVTNNTSNNRYYGISNTILIINQDDDDKKQILLSQLGIDTTDTKGVVQFKLTSPDQTYDAYVKQNYPSQINIPTVGTLKVCYANGLCSDEYKYKITDNTDSDNNSGIFQIDDRSFTVSSNNGYLNSEDVKKLVYDLLDKGLLTLYGDNNKTKWEIVFKDKNNNYVLLYSPALIHIKYIYTIRKNLSSSALLENVNWYDNIYVNDILLNKLFYPWVLEGKINYPEDIAKQIRLYDVAGTKVVYSNVIPYQEMSLINFLKDLKNQGIDITKLENTLFGETISDDTLNTIAKKINDNGGDQTGFITHILSYIVLLIVKIYPIALGMLIILLISMFFYFLVTKLNISTLRKGQDPKIDKFFFRAENIENYAKGKGDNVSLNKIGRIIYTPVLSYILLLIVLDILIHTNINYYLYSNLWFYMVILSIIIIIVSYFISIPLFKGSIVVIEKVISFVAEKNKL